MSDRASSPMVVSPASSADLAMGSREPGPYPGGKGGDGVYQVIINQMPPHRVYIEPFLGGGAIMRHKRPAMASIGIDSDANVLRMWRGYAGVPGLEVEQGDGVEWLARYQWRGDELVYCDPPYLMDTRSCQRPLYRVEMGDEADHERLLKVLVGLPTRVMISGYYSDLYADHLTGWRTVTFNAITRGGKVAEEWLWCNFPEPDELHDYRWLGGNYRERERVRKRQKRWRARLLAMSRMERLAMLSVIADLRDGHHHAG